MPKPKELGKTLTNDENLRDERLRAGENLYGYALADALADLDPATVLGVEVTISTIPPPSGTPRQPSATTSRRRS